MCAFGLNHQGSHACGADMQQRGGNVVVRHGRHSSLGIFSRGGLEEWSWHDSMQGFKTWRVAFPGPTACCGLCRGAPSKVHTLFSRASHLLSAGVV